MDSKVAGERKKEPKREKKETKVSHWGLKRQRVRRKETQNKNSTSAKIKKKTSEIESGSKSERREERETKIIKYKNKVREK